MDRKQLLDMLPHLIQNFRTGGEEKIATILAALEFSIQKDGSQEKKWDYLQKLDGFAKELMKDFPLSQEMKKNFEDSRKAMGDLLDIFQRQKDVKNTEPEIPSFLMSLFVATPPPRDPKKFC